MHLKQCLDTGIKSYLRHLENGQDSRREWQGGEWCMLQS